jgi:hypothetical protein
MDEVNRRGTEGIGGIREEQQEEGRSEEQREEREK